MEVLVAPILLTSSCSIFPGVAAMVLMSPLPVYLAKLMRGAQVQRMKKVRLP